MEFILIIVKALASWFILGLCALHAVWPINDKDTPIYYKLVWLVIFVVIMYFMWS